MAGRTFFVCLFLCLFSFVVGGDVLCEEGFCSSFINGVGCASPAADCSINNATHTGVWLPSPTMCNCCEYCLPFYGPNQHCSLGGTGTGTTIGRCTDGYYCVQHEDGDSYCQRMDTPCHRAQDDYDQRYVTGQVGVMEERPLCNGKGLYAHISCVPTQTCFCQTEDGERLFGEAPNTGPRMIDTMQCAHSETGKWVRLIPPEHTRNIEELGGSLGVRIASGFASQAAPSVDITWIGCSLHYNKIMTTISPGLPQPVTPPRCTTDGNYHPIQCLGDSCHCVNTITGTLLDGAAVHLDEKPISELSCYDPATDRYPEQSTGDPPYNFTTPCYETIGEVAEWITQSIEDGFIMDYYNSLPECLPDGSSGRIAISGNGTKICVDERGQQIENYSAEPGTPEFENMDCKCAVTSNIMTSHELPICCTNGNFRSVQCRRGVCWCVDSDGRQVGREAENIALLNCFTVAWRDC